MKTSRQRDVAIALVLFAIGYAAGSSYYRHFVRSGGRPQYYQRQLDASMMLACGRGFVGLQNPLPVPVDAFLLQESESIACSDIPPTLKTQPADVYQRVSRYMLLSVAGLWWLSGPSWSALVPLFGVLFGASAAGAYALFRVGMNRTLASLASLMFLASSAQYNNLPHLRDYAKAPFALGVMALAAWIASRPHSAQRLIALSAVAGGVVGTGLGFRTDLLLIAAAPPVAILFAPADRTRGHRVKAVALGAFVLAFVLSALPILRAYGGGNNIWHVTVLGMMSAFDEPLGISTPFYSLGRLYHDEYVSMAINSYSARVLGNPDALPLASKAYEQASLSYFREVLVTMPADLMIRVYASIIHILKLPFDSTAAPPEFLTGGTIESFYAVRARLLAWIAPVIPFLAAAVLAGVSSVSVRLAIFWVFAIALFAGMPALQYHQRHFFHLEVIGWLLLGVAVTGLNAFRAQRPTRTEWIRAASFLAVFAVLIFGTLASLRAYQRNTINALVRAILSAPATPMRTATSEDGWPIIRQADLSISADATAGVPRIRTTYLSVLVTPRCPYEAVPLSVLYGPPRASLSTTVTALLRDDAEAATRLIVPVYEQIGPVGQQPATALRHVEIHAPADCFGGLWRIETPPDIALLPFLMLDDKWPAADHFQSMRFDGPGERLYAEPPNRPVPRALRHAPLDAALTNPSYVSPPAVRSNGRWIVHGLADRQHSYLLMASEEIKVSGTKLIAYGSLERGGFTLGLLHQGRWSSRVDVTTPGRFRIVLNVPSDGAYQIVLANNLEGALHNSFSIDEIGWTRTPAK